MPQKVFNLINILSIMLKKIIAFNLSGTIISEEPGQKAHQEWFKIMGAALNDSSVEKLAEKKIISSSNVYSFRK